MIESKDQRVRVALYVRVSTEEQVKGGYGVELQQGQLEEMIRLKGQTNGWVTKPEWIFIDLACTGANLKRSGYKRMIEAAKNGEFDTIAVWKIDRLSRNLSHLLYVFEKLQKYKVSFYSLKESVDFSGAIGKLTFQIFGALAEFERETIRARTAEGKIASARFGNYVGNSIPYGYESIKNVGIKGKKLKTVKEEIKWVKQIFEWFVFERKNYSEIARELNRLKVPKGVSGRARNKYTKWQDVMIRDMLANSIYAGIRIQRIKDSDGDIQEIEQRVPRIVTDMLFQQARYVAKEISENKGKKGGGKNRYLLSRKIVDTITGRKYVGVSRRDGETSYRRKHFVDRKTGIVYSNREIPAAALENNVWDNVMLAINHPKKFFKIHQRSTANQRELENLLGKKEQAEFASDEASACNNSMLNDFYRGKISEKQRDEMQAEFEKTISDNGKIILECEQKIEKLIDAKIAEDALERFSKQFKETLENLSLEQKCMIVDMLVDRVEVADTEEQIDVTIHFRFAHNRQQQGDVVGEQENALQKKKTTSSDGSSGLTGRGDRT